MIIDILRRANAKVVTVSIEDKLEILASRNTKLVADMLFEDSAKLHFDIILLPVSSLPLSHTQYPYIFCHIFLPIFITFFSLHHRHHHHHHHHLFPLLFYLSLHIILFYNSFSHIKAFNKYRVG